MWYQNTRVHINSASNYVITITMYDLKVKGYFQGWEVTFCDVFIRDKLYTDLVNGLEKMI